MNKSNELVKKMLILSKSNDFENAIEEWKKLDSDTCNSKQKKCMISHQPYCCRKFANLETCSVVYLKNKYCDLRKYKNVVVEASTNSLTSEKLLSYGLYNYLNEKLRVLRLLKKIKNSYLRKKSISFNDFFEYYKKILGFEGLIKLFLKIKKMRKCDDIPERHKKLFDFCYDLLKKKYKKKYSIYLSYNYPEKIIHKNVNI